MENITSKSNEKVKYIKSLNEKKFRQKYNSYYLEGVKVVNELLDMYEKKAVEVTSIAYSFDILSKVNGGLNLIDRISNMDINYILVDSKIFDYMTDTVTSQGVLAVVVNNNKTIKDLDINSDIVILDRLKDLGNIGTIIRTCDSFKVKNIICISGTADCYSQKVLRSTMASILRENIIYISEDKILDVIKILKEKGYNIISTSLKTNKYIDSNIFDGKSAIVLGNEANGISDIFIENSDILVKIPMSDSAESLNVACAASIMLYENFKNK